MIPFSKFKEKDSVTVIYGNFSGSLACVKATGFSECLVEFPNGVQRWYCDHQLYLNEKSDTKEGLT